MPTNAFTGVGTTLQSSDMEVTPAFTTIPEVRNIGGPELSVESVEATSLDSTGGYKEYISGLKDGGSVSFELNYTGHAQQQLLRTDLAAGTLRDYRITWPNSPATVVDFAATVESFSMTTEPNAPVSVSVTLKISGAPTWTN